LERSIGIRGARTHNLRNLSLDIPHRQLTVVTGVSGSGKSSLVFDTLYAEGQRRYVQSLSTYARLFLERMDRPDVDSITDIPPALALKQKNTIKNARSTVGTITEISDHLRLLYAAAGKTFCPRCNQEVTSDTIVSTAAKISARPGLYLFVAPFPLGSRSLPDAAAYLIENGYHRVYSSDAIFETHDWLSRNSNGGARSDTIDVVVDRLAIASDSNEERIREAVEKSFYLGAGRMRAILVERINAALTPLATLDFDRRFNCSSCGDSFPEPVAGLFSSNTPLGACPECEGFGRTTELDLDKVLPDPRLSLRQGLVAPWRTSAYREMHEWMIKCARRCRVRTAAPFAEMSADERSWLLDGEPGQPGKHWDERWPGVRGFFRWLERKRYKTHVRIWLARYRRFVPCPRCGGSRLKPEALNVVVGGKTIAQASQLAVRDLPGWFKQLRRDRSLVARCAVVLRELENRVGYLNEVGLGYLTLDRQGRTLSGGEAQRIHLASALGSLLSATLYALDEPTVGLHASDSRRLLGVLRRLRDLGNTVVVVEHDPVMIAGADYLVELGPQGGQLGGQLLRAGPPQEISSGANDSATSGRVLLMRALSQRKNSARRATAVRIIGARENNLRNLDVDLPLNRLICVTGVSGSGKSTLIETVLYNYYLRRTGESVSDVGACDRIEGLDQISEMVHMGQEMPARSMRSNAATYLKIYDEIRRLFASSPAARRLKVKPRDFSFNVTGGRCEQCGGVGTVVLEMHFMADLDVKCDACDGRRFQSHILAIRFQGLNINDVLDLTVDQAMIFFARHGSIVKQLEPLSAVGLGYLKLGQPTSTLSGGEAQRLKLARFLLADLSPSNSASSTRRMFILDEPTTGLASSDVKRLIRVLTRLVNEGNSVIVIEHNLEFIAQADHIIDLGPGGGDQGGKIVASGPPMKVAASQKSLTARELRALFGVPARPSGGSRTKVHSPSLTGANSIGT
jgi:excinuclease ABC subunit A